MAKLAQRASGSLHTSENLRPHSLGFGEKKTYFQCACIHNINQIQKSNHTYKYCGAEVFQISQPFNFHTLLVRTPIGSSGEKRPNLQKISLGSEIIWGLILTALASGFLQFPCHLNSRPLNNIIFTIIKEEKIFTLSWDNCDLI